MCAFSPESQMQNSELVKWMDFLSTQSIVEVRGKQGFDGWYEAKIIGSYRDPTGKFSVQYDQPGMRVYARVDISLIRPLPPPPAADQTYKPHDVVDALCGGGWRKGVVSKVKVFEKEKRFIVLFENPFQELAFSSQDLRVHSDWSWTHGWLPPPKQEIINIEEDCDDDKTAYLSKVVPETEETLPKKRGREMNAQVIMQKVAAAEEEEKQGARVSLNGSRTSDNHGEKQSSVKKSRKNLLEQSAAEEDKTNEGSAEVINGENVQNSNQSSSSAVNVKPESEPARDKNLPFVKSSYMWKEFDSQEVFRILPQTPHFSSLWDFHEQTREGLAIGHMVTFASVVEKVSKLQIEDPTHLFLSYLEALDILQEIGFDVKVVADRVNDLLSLNTRQEEFQDESKRCQSLVVECDEKKAKLEEENIAIDKMIGELEAKRSANVSLIVKEDSTRDFLQLRASTIEDFMLDMKQKFKINSAAPWQRLI